MSDLNENYGFQKESLPEMHLEKLLRIEAQQKAAIRTIITILVDGDHEKIEKYWAIFNAFTVAEAAAIVKYEYTKYGRVDLSDIFPANEPPTDDDK